MNVFYFKFLTFLGSIFLISSCGGGEAGPQVASIAPQQAFVLNVDRTFFVGIDSFITIPKPSTQFQLRIDNRGNPNPLTIVGMTLTVDGPAKRTVIPVDPFINLFRYNSSLDLNQVNRAIFAEIQPYQTSFCLDKVTDLKQINYSPSCSTIAAQDATVNIPTYGVAAAGTSEDPTNSNVCCPGNAANLQDIFVFVGGLQTGATSLTGTQNYNISADIFGYYGTIVNPVSNFNQRVFFSARSF